MTRIVTDYEMQRRVLVSQATAAFTATMRRVMQENGGIELTVLEWVTALNTCATGLLTVGLNAEWHAAETGDEACR